MELRAREVAVATRRRALKTGLDAATALLVAAIVPPVARGAEVKLSKSLVQYTDAGNAPHMDCDDCIQFMPGKTAKDKGLCKIVEGDIDPHGHCLAFSPKPKA
jgi:hypothetical protein